MRKQTKRRAIRYSLLGVNFLLIAVVVWFVLRNPSASVAVDNSVTASANNSATTDPLDQLTSADIAENVARLDDLPEETAITNQADSEDAELSITQASANLVAKPQVVATTFASNQDIQQYTVKSGDTVASIASMFHITSNSVMWSNGLSGNTVSAGQKLYIPPVNGIVYVVASGDTPQNLASKYHASESLIIAYNDAELTGIHVGERIIIPNGQVQTQTAAATGGSLYGGNDVATWGLSAIYSNNGYDFGYCTWWVAQRRAEVGEPLPTNLGNAATWAYLAQQFGLSTGSTPQKYAAAVMSTVGEGHVGFVEAVYPNGSIKISEMNVVGWDVEDTQTIPASVADTYSYIY
jgi:surface antigen